jgi:hypothetical protein
VGAGGVVTGRVVVGGRVVVVGGRVVVVTGVNVVGGAGFIASLILNVILMTTAAMTGAVTIRLLTSDPSAISYLQEPPNQSYSGTTRTADSKPLVVYLFMFLSMSKASTPGNLSSSEMASVLPSTIDDVARASA